MNNLLEEQVAQHYTHGALERTILAALQAAGKNPEKLELDDLEPFDEFHAGGREATVEFGSQMKLAPGSHVLDVGCGVGGPARYFARTLGWRVMGIDLTKEFVEGAISLSKRAGMEGFVSFQQANAVATPLQSGTFDGAYTIHVAMNIEDKASLFREVRRLLKPGGTFGIFDIMREGEGPLTFPLPWARTKDTSFVETIEKYRELLRSAGFKVERERNRRTFTAEFFHKLKARAAANGGKLPPLGLHLLVGEEWPQRIQNFAADFGRGLVSPVEMVCRAQ